MENYWESVATFCSHVFSDNRVSPVCKTNGSVRPDPFSQVFSDNRVSPVWRTNGTVRPGLVRKCSETTVYRLCVESMEVSGQILFRKCSVTTVCRLCGEPIKVCGQVLFANVQ
ncbi:hypothetical protein PoB_003378000 [Plakobranchus ocellatus]|uniref:Uncharacterized protein n=1 Tax=Plakobranchus ocellatus TaxID=259542 RepID=A0AAV4AKA4_9GAST|nr:hypothetical protein PoB_003378000 [Plakobranchus ocellatus]